MDGLLKVSRAVDAVNDVLGIVANWLVLAACLLSAGNAMIRYSFNAALAVSEKFPNFHALADSLSGYGHHANAFLEAQWYMFAAMVLLGGPYVLKINEHVRVDLFYGIVSERTRNWIDLVGAILFLLPICVILVYFTWPWFVESWSINEASSNAGGLLRWPVKLLLPLGFGLMALQGVSEIIKRIAALAGHRGLQYRYEKPLQ